MSNNLFGGMKSDGLEQSQDRLGGFQVFDSKIYHSTIKALYAGEAKSGAMNLSVVLDLGGGQEYRETVYITNKKKQNYFEKDGKKQPLPGFTLINDLCLIATEKELSQLATEEKIIKLWDNDQKKEVPTAVQMVTEAIGKPVAVGILKALENKQVKSSTGEYVPTAETRETNRIDKVFHPEAKVTVAEARSGKKEAGFWDAWTKRNEGKVRDDRAIKDGKGGAPGAPPTAGGSTDAPVKKSLFGK